MHTSASFEKLLHDHGHYLDDLYIITVRYVNYLEAEVDELYKIVEGMDYI